jgi:hypothetical protein
MSLQQFEQWLLSEDDLNPQQQLELEEELARNPELGALRDRLQAVDLLLKSAVMLEPQPGFVGRWKSRVKREREKKGRRQTFKLLAALSLIGVVSLGLAGLLLFSSPAELASSALKAIVGLRAQSEFVWDFLAAIIPAIPGAMGAFMLSGLLAALAWLSVAWITSLYRYAYLERRNGV